MRCCYRKARGEWGRDVGDDWDGFGCGSDLQHALVVRFLTSIGALPPWQNPIRLDASFKNATLGEDGGEPEGGVCASADGVGRESKAKKHSASLDEEIERMRHDFGKDHTVYVIDDEGAFELTTVSRLSRSKVKRPSKLGCTYTSPILRR